MKIKSFKTLNEDGKIAGRIWHGEEFPFRGPDRSLKVFKHAVFQQIVDDLEENEAEGFLFRHCPSVIVENDFETQKEALRLRARAMYIHKADNPLEEYAPMKYFEDIPA